MGEIIKLDNIRQYNEMVGQETLHPLVSVLDLSKSSRMMKHARMSFGFYAVFLKEVKCGDLTQLLRLSGRHAGFSGSRTGDRLR